MKIEYAICGGTLYIPCVFPYQNINTSRNAHTKYGAHTERQQFLTSNAISKYCAMSINKQNKQPRSDQTNEEKKKDESSRRRKRKNMTNRETPKIDDFIGRTTYNCIN